LGTKRESYSTVKGAGQSRQTWTEHSVQDGSPGFDQDNAHAAEETQNLSICLMTALVEKAVNQALLKEAAAIEALIPLAGRVIRLKTHDPYLVIYCQILETGVRLLTQFDGKVDVRVQMPAGKLLVSLLQTGRGVVDEADFEISVFGDRQVLDEVNLILEQFSILKFTSQLLQEWLPGYDALASDAKLWLEGSVPPWVRTWQQMPELANDLMVEVKHMAETQSAMLTELVALRSQKANNGVHWVHWLGLIMVFLALFSFHVQQ